MIIPTIELGTGRLRIIDQRLLPAEYTVLDVATIDALCEIITTLAIRGAPALGIAGAYGLLLAVEERWGGGDVWFFDQTSENVAAFPAAVSREELVTELERANERLAATRPTAVNLFWALDRMGGIYRTFAGSTRDMLRALHREALAIYEEDLEMSRALGAYGATLLEEDAAVLTHCNAGGLATSGFGTALGVVYAAVEAGKRIRVFADETRPLLQGARLTAWECVRNNIPVTVIAEGMAGHVLSKRLVSCVIVGADRIAANGDTANKIGTLNLAIIAGHYGIPFYVAAPSSTVDPATASGAQITIEERPEQEVTYYAGVPVAPADARALNPAFDITPAELISAIITERGIFYPPFDGLSGV